LSHPNPGKQENKDLVMFTTVLGLTGYNQALKAEHALLSLSQF